jgi:hypothetical protein
MSDRKEDAEAAAFKDIFREMRESGTTFTHT